MQKHVFVIFVSVITILILCLSGCGQIKVEGKVTFPDGTPLTKGKVFFENNTNSYIGDIHEDGTFRLGILKDGSGIPAGKYGVGVEAFNVSSPSGNLPTTNNNKNQRNQKNKTVAPKNKAERALPLAVGRPEITHLIAEKYRSSKTSGIEYDIQKNTRDISIIVEKP
ncbi:MAG: hypothetical protein LBK06_03155 [Planctomycetaceae bacterium]|jgi:hypothetical protein|nr:hypothetical protein [Planctomycetaceae bacterium]